MITTINSPTNPELEFISTHDETKTVLFANEGEAVLLDAIHFHADSANALACVNAMYEITANGGEWFAPRRFPIMRDALEEYIGFLTAEIETFDNFRNELEKAEAVEKRTEAQTILSVFSKLA